MTDSGYLIKLSKNLFGSYTESTQLKALQHLWVAAVFLSFRKMYVNEEQGGEEQIISSEFVRISICQKN